MEMSTVDTTVIKVVICLIINWEVVQRLDCTEPDCRCAGKHWWMGTTECTCFQFPPATYFSLSLSKHGSKCGCVYSRKRTWVKVNFCFQLIPRFILIFVKFNYGMKFGKLHPRLQRVCFPFPPQGEWTFSFLHLDSDSESAQAGALGSHGSTALSHSSQVQPLSQSVCVGRGPAGPTQGEVSCSTAQFLISFWVRQMCSQLPATSTTRYEITYTESQTCEQTQTPSTVRVPVLGSFWALCSHVFTQDALE